MPDQAPIMDANKHQTQNHTSPAAMAAVEDGTKAEKLKTAAGNGDLPSLRALLTDDIDINMGLDEVYVHMP